MFQSITKGILHFEDLSSLQFEDLYRKILVTSNEYCDIRPYGIKGSDNGVDILCTEKATGTQFFIQCKRYNSLCLSHLKTIVDRIVESRNDYKGQAVSIVASCDISRDARDNYELYALSKGFSKAFFIGKRELDDILYLDRFEKVRVHFFGTTIDREEIARQKIKKSEQGEILVNKLLQNIDFTNPSIRKKLFDDPSFKFKYSDIIVKSIYDDVYPDCNADGRPSSWFRLFLHDLYNDGIQVHIDAYRYEHIVVDCCGNWMLKQEYEEKDIHADVIELKVDIIGRIPYYNIVNIKEKGDFYYSYPIVLCVFDEIKGPYSEICYEYHDMSTNKRIFFEKGQRAWISEYEFKELKDRWGKAADFDD